MRDAPEPFMYKKAADNRTAQDDAKEEVFLPGGEPETEGGGKFQKKHWTGIVAETEQEIPFILGNQLLPF